MALPLPRVVSDVGPGGGLVTAAKGINSLRDAYYNSNYNKVKSELARTTLGAEAASKLAYANMLGPQYLAKVFGNTDFLAGLTEAQRSALPDLLLKAGVGGGGNSLNQMPNMPNMPQMGQQSNNSLLDTLKSGVQNVLGNFGMGNKPNQNAMNMPQQQMTGSPQGQTMGSQGAMPQEGMQPQNPEDEALSAWLATPEAQKDIPAGPDGMPDRNKLYDWYYGHGQKPPMGMTLNEGQRQETLAEKSGKFLGTKEQGKEAGKYRAEAKRDIGRAQLALSGSGAALNTMTKIHNNPVWQNMRKLPAFQKEQLSVLKVTGTDEEKELAGKFESAAQSIIANAVAGMGSRHLVREYDLAERQKISPSDTIPAAEGKLKNAIELHDIAEQKNDIISNLLSQGVDEADAVKIANKKVDVSAIERRTEKLFQNKITEDDITTTAKENNMTREEVIKRLKKEGRYNG